MSDLKTLQQQVADFSAERDWAQFHQDPKNTLIALGSELGELMELYRFTTVNEARQRIQTHKAQVEDELGDILYLILMFCHQNNIDLETAFANKVQKRAKNIPSKSSKASMPNTTLYSRAKNARLNR